MADVPIYDPIIAHHRVRFGLFAYLYSGLRRAGRMEASIAKRNSGVPPSLDGTVIVFDTETVRHQLTFGVALFLKTGDAKSAWSSIATIFGNRSGGLRPPLQNLRQLDTEPGPRLKLVKLEWFFQNGIWPARKHGWVISGHNIVYDLSRIADSWEKATRTARLGARFCNGFALKHHFMTKDGLQTPIFCRIKRDDRHHVRFDMKNAVVVDTQSADFAYTDRNHSLKKACEAWGIPFEDRPGSIAARSRSTTSADAVTTWKRRPSCFGRSTTSTRSIHTVHTWPGSRRARPSRRAISTPWACIHG